ncbi:MAG: LysO family transporter [Bacteroidaceae bacterium]
MLIVIGILFLGVITGFIIQKRKTLKVNSLIMGLICSLLFILGVEVGENKSILQNFNTLGIEAIVITIGAVIGSILFAWLLWFFIQKKQN